MTTDQQAMQWTESGRLAALARYSILDTPPEQSFDNIVQMTAIILNVPIAAINLIDSDRQWFKSEIGLGVQEMPLDNSICSRVMLTPGNTLIPDTLEDPRFNCNPLVTSEPGLRFYAGELLLTPEGYPLGTLCALDTKPRPEGLSSQQRFMLKALAEQVMTQLELRRVIQQRENLLVEQQRAHALHRQILNSAIDYAIMSLDLKGKVISWNAGAQNVLGWSEEEMRGQSIKHIFTPEDIASGVPETEWAIALQQERAIDERWHLRKDGGRFWASGELTPLKNDSDQVVGFVKVLRDRTQQKRMEADLHRLNQTLESQVGERTRERNQLWRNSSDLFIVIGQDGVIHAVNPAWTRILGHAPEEVIGQSITMYIHPDDRASVSQVLSQTTSGPLARFENRCRHLDGSYRWLAWTSAIEDGFIYGNARDITTEKKQSEQLAMLAEARMQLALDAGGMGAWQWDIQTNEIFWMHGSAELHGRPSSPRLRFHFNDYLKYVVAEDVDSLRQAVEETILQQTDLHVEYRILLPNNTVRWIEGRGKLVRSESGEPIEMVGVSIDITRRKKTEQNLRFLAQVSAELASLHDPKSTLDKVARLAVPTFADWCVVDLLDEEQDDLKRVAVAHIDPEKVELVREMGRRFPPEKDAPHGAWNIVRSRKPELIHEITEEILAISIKNEEYRETLKVLGLRSYLAAPLVAHGKVLGVISFIAAESGQLYGEEDLTLAEDLARRAGIAIENAHLYDTMRQSDHGKDVFLATLAHELRNPLAAVSNALSITRLATDDKKRVEQATQIIERQTDHLTRLVDDLMEISRIATGKIELRKEVVSLTSILTNAVETSRNHIVSMDHRLLVRLPGEPSEVYADAVRLTQVFANLLNNAAKYTDPGGQIEVTLEGGAEEFIVRIKDTGIGIPPEMLKNIFNIFAQIDHPLERSAGGLGIGLSLVDGMVKLHGGRVEAFSAGLNKGSEFVVHLPRQVPPPDRESNSTEPLPENNNSQARPLRILVVDDNVDAASTLADILQMLDNEVVGVLHDGLQAMETALQLTPDVVLLDIGLPGLDGYEVAQRLRMHKEMDKVTLIALTGWGHEKDKQRAREAGFDHHLVKPVRLEQLQEILSGAWPRAL